VTLVFEADPNWLVVTVLFSKTDIKDHECGSAMDYIDRGRKKVARRHTAVFIWKKNENTWSTEREIDGLGDGCAAKITCEEDIGGGNRNTMCKGKGQWSTAVLILWWNRKKLYSSTILCR
jgi:hypothetical protein